MRSIPRLVIAGAASGSGKTSLTVALTAALRQRGLVVQCFKCGPDYLDPSYHTEASGRLSHNLDSWMMGSQAVRDTFERLTQDADIALIEGVMGLFDGTSPRSNEGSTAEIAKILEAPVIVALDASGMARTIAALALGLSTFDPELEVRGFIANRVGSRSHLDILRQAMPPQTLLGGLPKSPELAFPERHLGLVTANQNVLSPERLAAWAKLAEEFLDIEAILAVSRSAGTWSQPQPLATTAPGSSRCRIGIARDAAFHFYYEANLQLLRQYGAELVFFSPLSDAALPEYVDALYLGGGYPEVFAAQLARQEGMRTSIQRFVQGGGLVYAECGGLMYLGESLKNLEGEEFPMLGLLPVAVQMHERLQSLGYTEVEVQEASLLGPAGTRFRGHQFRYSSLLERRPLQHLYRIRKRRGGEVQSEGYASTSVLGSYVHAHWASNPEVARNFVNCAEARREVGLSLN